MSLDIVVARYNEDLSWLKDLPKGKNIKIWIYNKGDDNINLSKLKLNLNSKNCCVIKLPNIGRESHTYLNHIITQYDNLASKTVFCQGDSIFHSPDFIELIKNHKLFEPIQPLSSWYWPEGEPPKYLADPPQPLLDKTKDLWIKGGRVHVEYMDNDFQTVYPYYFREDYYVHLINFVKKEYNVSNVLKFNVDRLRLKNVDLNKLFPICYAGLFCANKDVIRENSIDFYNNIMSILLYDTRKTHYEKPLDFGLFLEKLWLLIFNYPKNNKNYLDLNVSDYKIYDVNLPIKNNTINFSMFNIVCQIFIELNINNQYYKFYISRNIITMKDDKNKKLVHYEPTNNNKIKNKTVLKDMTKVNVKISLKNNEFDVSLNDISLIHYKFNFKNNVSKITEAKIMSITKDNNLIVRKS